MIFKLKNNLLDCFLYSVTVCAFASYYKEKIIFKLIRFFSEGLITFWQANSTERNASCEKITWRLRLVLVNGRLTAKYRVKARKDCQKQASRDFGKYEIIVKTNLKVRSKEPSSEVGNELKSRNRDKWGVSRWKTSMHTPITEY